MGENLIFENYFVLTVSIRTAISLYGFYILTKTEPEYDQVENRWRLLYTHKYAPDDGFEIQDFNKKMRRLQVINDNLSRLRDPLRLQLPIRQKRLDSTRDLY